MAGRPLSGRAYVFTWLALVGLTALSFLASRVHLGTGLDLAVSLGIAATKTVLVLLFFMHLIEQRPAHRLAVVVSVLLTLLLVSLTAADVATRHTGPKGPEPPSAEESPPAVKPALPAP